MGDNENLPILQGRLSSKLRLQRFSDLTILAMSLEVVLMVLPWDSKLWPCAKMQDMANIAVVFDLHGDLSSPKKTKLNNFSLVLTKQHFGFLKLDCNQRFENISRYVVCSTYYSFQSYEMNCAK